MVACEASAEILTNGGSNSSPGPARTSVNPGTSSANSNGSFPFRLSGENNGARPSSVVSSDQQSVYKQRIDAMFDETRSILYGHAPDPRRSSSSGSQNMVQAKIEKMFQDIVTTSEEENSLTNIEIQQFKVHYVGNTALVEKETTLQNLQKPLKELYFKYLKLESKNSKPPVGKLEISTQGLNVIQSGQAELNPFSSIAVWAAVKCVSREDGKKLAFLPLIADPDGQDKSALFSDLSNPEEVELACGLHSPLLAVVMRQSASKQLFCHVYECTCSEDAIVMAANLYQALMSNMKAKQITIPNIIQENNNKPIRPPRNKSKSKNSSEDEEILPEPTSNKSFQSHQRRISVAKVQDPTGDILTKIAIPRSRSFLMKNAARGGNSSLHDLFAEIKTQEGITNMDEVLEKIVNKNGMSFNDLKPLYKELLLKLAVTLTRDELYLRSKNIMKRQQKLTPTKRTMYRTKSKRGLKHAFRRSVKKLHTTVTCHKSPPSSFEFTSVLFPTVKRNGGIVARRNSISSSCSSYHTMRRRGVRERAKRQREAVETRLSSIANREIRRNIPKKSESPMKRESSSGYVSCSECSLTSCLCDTDSCLESDKCYCSLQNNKKTVVTSTSWRHHLNKPPSTHTSRSLQILLNQPIRKRPSSFTSRMDVYDAIPPPPVGSGRVSGSVSVRSKARSASVDNLALDYELFRYSQQNSVRSQQQQQRVLVVSARDNTGRLIYMGAAEKTKKKLSRDPAHEALAVKKSAEIASLFSDMKLSQTTNIRGVEFEEQGEQDAESDYNTLEPPEIPPPSSRRGSYPGSALENSLGYLP